MSDAGYRPFTASDGALAGRVWAWIDDEVDPAAAAQLTTLITRMREGDAAAGAELADRFAAPLAFGTAGLRGPLRAGPNGMNRTVVRRAAAGLARWLGTHADVGATVVVGYDARHGSRDFAHDSAAVFAAAGLDARLLPGPLPTPVLAFAVRHLHAAAGVMVTASHNPPRDNGYKVYGADGAQIVPPTDREIEDAIRAVGPTRSVPMSDQFRVLGDNVAQAYVGAVAALARPGARHLTVVHTAMHGVGTRIVERVFTAAGFAPPITVPQQAEPDPDFPTVSFPNPEEPGALDLAVALARERRADIVIANDPDADRCGVAVPFPGTGWRMLRGDEVGGLLADDLLRRGVRGTYATTIVSSSLLAAMASEHHVGYVETLTGFKWITRAADDLVYGYEEALGYAVAPTLVRDKDGISAALRLAELAAELTAAGSSVPDRLDQIAAQYGVYATDQISLRVTDLSRIDDAMARLRADPPTTLLGHVVTATDRRPEADVLTLRWDSGRVVVRPSGTEPKLKAYLEVILPRGGPVDAARAAAAARLARLRGEVTDAVDL